MVKEIIIKGNIISKDNPMICVPVVETTADAIISGTHAAIDAGVKMVELRADYYEGLTDTDSLMKLLKDVSAVCDKTVLLFTIRSVREGGKCELSQEEIEAILVNVAEQGCVDMIDYEYSQNNEAVTVIAKLKEYSPIIVASHHDFDYTPSNEDMELLLSRMDRCGADIVKLAVMPHSFKDALRLMEVSCDCEATSKHPFITMSMGDYGKISRVAGRFTGSVVTFASLGSASAPGQIEFKDMRTI